MDEWILVLALDLAGGVPGEIRDVSWTTVSGFTSATSCEAAAQTIAERATGVVGNEVTLLLRADESERERVVRLVNWRERSLSSHERILTLAARRVVQRLAVRAG